MQFLKILINLILIKFVLFHEYNDIFESFLLLLLHSTLVGVKHNSNSATANERTFQFHKFESSVRLVIANGRNKGIRFQHVESAVALHFCAYGRVEKYKECNESYYLRFYESDKVTFEM